MGCFVRGGRNGMGCFVWGGKNGMGCFIRGDKNYMGCFVRGGKSMRDVLSGVAKNGMGCFVLHSCPKGVNHSQNNSTLYCYFSKFWDIPTVLCNHPKILPQSNTIKRCRQKCKSFNPDQTVSLYTSTVSTEKL